MENSKAKIPRIYLEYLQSIWQSVCPVEHQWGSGLLSEVPAEDRVEKQSWTMRAHGRMQTKATESFCSPILPSFPGRTEAKLDTDWAKLTYLFSKLKAKNNQLAHQTKNTRGLIPH